MLVTVTIWFLSLKTLKAHTTSFWLLNLEVEKKQCLLRIMSKTSMVPITRLLESQSKLNRQKSSLHTRPIMPIRLTKMLLVMFSLHLLTRSIIRRGISRDSHSVLSNISITCGSSKNLLTKSVNFSTLILTQTMSLTCHLKI